MNIALGSDLEYEVGKRYNFWFRVGLFKPTFGSSTMDLTTELGPYVKLWGFFIYDHQKYRPKNSQDWASKEQMTGALYMEFGLYLMVGLEAKTLFLEYDKDFVDVEFPLLSAGERRYYCYAADYEPEGEDDEIVIYDNETADQWEGCAVSMVLPEYTYALKYMDLSTGRQGTSPLSPQSYTFKVSNPNFRVDNVKSWVGRHLMGILENGKAVSSCDARN